MQIAAHSVLLVGPLLTFPEGEQRECLVVIASVQALSREGAKDGTSDSDSP